MDECVDAALVARLREVGHDATYVAEFASAAPDVDVIERASTEQRLLLTEDKDFGELLWRRRWSVPGLVFVRIAPAIRAVKWPRLETAIDTFGERLFGRFTVGEAGRFRSRALSNGN